jgi:hypothetical protein
MFVCPAGAASLLPKELGWDSAGQISRAALALEQVGSVFGEVSKRGLVLCTCLLCVNACQLCLVCVLFMASPLHRSTTFCNVQVGNGATDFTPTPAESREIIRKGYTTPTLLVRFANDTIGEQSQLVMVLNVCAVDSGGATSSRFFPLPEVTQCCVSA